MSSALFAGLTAFSVTFLLTPVVRSAAVRFGWISRPAEDRWGHRTIARLGGAAMFVGFIAASLAWVPNEPRLLFLYISLTLVCGLGLLDDLRRLGPNTKLIAQLLIGCLVVLGGSRISLPQWTWLSIPLSVMWFVLIMNAFNLLDNMDGLAAGVGAIAAAFCAIHAALAGNATVLLLNAALCGACLGFLRYNFPPAKIYMGDAGSHFIGLSLAALSLAGSWQHSTQLLSVLAVPTLVLAVPIFDTCFVTIQRLLHGQHPFVGGTDHISHRLAILGLSTRQSVTALYAISVTLGLLSVVTAKLNIPTTLALWLLVVTTLALFGRYLARVQVYRLVAHAPAAASEPLESGAAVTRIETMLLHKRRLLETLIDFCLLSLAYVFAHLLRFEGVLTEDLQQMVLRSLPVILVAKLSCLGGFGVYRGVWRYLGLPDLITMFKAITLGSVISACALLYLWRFDGFSRAVFIIDWLLSMVLIGGARVTERLLDEWIHHAVGRGTPVLIVGAGDTGAAVLRSLRYEGPVRYRVVGFVDDDPAKRGSRIQGAAVLGSRVQLAELIEAQGVREVMVAIGDPPGGLLEYVRDCCESRQVEWRVVSAGLSRREAQVSG